MADVAVAKYRRDQARLPIAASSLSPGYLPIAAPKNPGTWPVRAPIRCEFQIILDRAKDF
jgi:hypothetical protein